MHNSLKLHFVYTTGRLPLPSTNMPWYLHHCGQDEGWLAVGQGGTGGGGGRSGCRMGPRHPPAGWPWVTAAAAPRLAPSPGLRPKEQAPAQRRKVPALSTSGSRPQGCRQWGASLGKGCPHTLWREDAWDREGAGLSLHRGSELPYRRLPSQPRHIPRTPARSNRGSTAGGWQDPGKATGTALEGS